MSFGRHKAGAATLMIASIILGMGIAPAGAASPMEGTVSADQEVTWTGGPPSTVPVPYFLGYCLAIVHPRLKPVDPTCDHFALTVDATSGTKVMVAVAADLEGDDFDVYVYYPDGSEAAVSFGPGNEVLVFEHRTDHGDGPYDVQVQPGIVLPGSTYQGMAKITDEPLQADESGLGTLECWEFVPDTASIDSGGAISLDVSVLLDGVSPARGQEIMDKAAEAYAPLNIALNSTFEEVTFSSTDLGAVLKEGKAYFDGERPAGSDVVYVLSARDIRAGAGVGYAECVGGVRWPDRSFSVGVDYKALSGTDVGQVGPFFVSTDISAQIAAHEIGHLLGGDHHHANCIQGIDPAEVARWEVTPCTLMFAADGSSLVFGSLEAAIVRGHAEKYADN